MAQVLDKDKEIDKLVKHYVTLEGEKKVSEIKVDRLKEKLKGYSMLQSTQNAIWDIIIDEVNKLWPDLQDYEKKKTYVSSAFYRERSANNLLLQLDTKVEEIALKAIKFLKHCNREALAVLQITDRFKFMSKAQKIVEKSKARQKLQEKISVLQKDIKQDHSAMKKMFDKGLPFFWDEKNVLIPKEEYHKLLGEKINDYSLFKNMDGVLRGEVVLEKLGELFEIMTLMKNLKLNSSNFEEYLDLEVESRLLVEIDIVNKAQFRDISKLALALLKDSPVI